MGSQFEIFHVTYKPALPFQEGAFGPDTLMIVSTQGGRADARAACEKYHKGCKVEYVASLIETLAGVKPKPPEPPASKKTKKKK